MQACRLKGAYAVGLDVVAQLRAVVERGGVGRKQGEEVSAIGGDHVFQRVEHADVAGKAAEMDISDA